MGDRVRWAEGYSLDDGGRPRDGSLTVPADMRCPHCGKASNGVLRIRNNHLHSWLSTKWNRHSGMFIVGVEMPNPDTGDIATEINIRPLKELTEDRFATTTVLYQAHLGDYSIERVRSCTDQDLTPVYVGFSPSRVYEVGEPIQHGILDANRMKINDVHIKALYWCGYSDELTSKCILTISDGRIHEVNEL